MNTTALARTIVDGYLLGEWLEDKDRFARYELVSYDEGGVLVRMIEASVWVCVECEHIADMCECGDDLANDLDL